MRRILPNYPPLHQVGSPRRLSPGCPMMLSTERTANLCGRNDFGRLWTISRSIVPLGGGASEPKGVQLIQTETSSVLHDLAGRGINPAISPEARARPLTTRL